MKNKLWKRLSVILLALLVMGGTSVAVRAESIYDILMNELKEAMKEPVNTSYLSAEWLMTGETLTMVAQEEGVNPDKCQYGFYLRVKGMFWMTLQKYSTDRVCTWTPSASADYEICIKVKYGQKIAKKYFDVRVTEPLTVRSYVSTSYIQQGETVELTGLAEGGFGEISYGFYYKSTDEINWTTLSGFSAASNIRWKPQKAGTYDVCIKVKDQDIQSDEKYATLTVAQPQIKTPASFTVTVKSPISSPYFWQCSVDDKELIGYEVTEQTVQMERLKTYVLREYRFTTLSAGRTSVHLFYDTHSGQHYTLDYDITIDKNLNYTVNASEGSYFEQETMPKLQPVTGSFSIFMPKETGAGRWKCEISNNLVAEMAGSTSEAGEGELYSFTILRQGYFTVTFRCRSGASMTDQYRLIYNLYADENLHVSLIDRDGYYIDGYYWPDIIVPQTAEDNGESENT